MLGFVRWSRCPEYCEYATINVTGLLKNLCMDFVQIFRECQYICNWLNFLGSTTNCDEFKATLKSNNGFLKGFSKNLYAWVLFRACPHMCSQPLIKFCRCKCQSIAFYIHLFAHVSEAFALKVLFSSFLSHSLKRLWDIAFTHGIQQGGPPTSEATGSNLGPGARYLYFNPQYYGD